MKLDSLRIQDLKFDESIRNKIMSFYTYIGRLVDFLMIQKPNDKLDVSNYIQVFITIVDFYCRGLDCRKILNDTYPKLKFLGKGAFNISLTIEPRLPEDEPLKDCILRVFYRCESGSYGVVDMYDGNYKRYFNTTRVNKLSHFHTSSRRANDEIYSIIDSLKPLPQKLRLSVPVILHSFTIPHIVHRHGSQNIAWTVNARAVPIREFNATNKRAVLKLLARMLYSCIDQYIDDLNYLESRLGVKLKFVNRSGNTIIKKKEYVQNVLNTSTPYILKFVNKSTTSADIVSWYANEVLDEYDENDIDLSKTENDECPFFYNIIREAINRIRNLFSTSEKYAYFDFKEDNIGLLGDIAVITDPTFVSISSSIRHTPITNYITDISTSVYDVAPSARFRLYKAYIVSFYCFVLRDLFRPNLNKLTQTFNEICPAYTVINIMNIDQRVLLRIIEETAELFISPTTAPYKIPTYKPIIDLDMQYDVST